MIVSVSDSGVLELFWRHSISRKPNREKAFEFIAGIRQAGYALSITRPWFEKGVARKSAGGAQTLDLVARAIASGEYVVLQHRSETRWHGTRMPIVAISPTALILSQARTRRERDLDHALHWLQETASLDDLSLLWQRLWMRYGKSEAPAPHSTSSFSSELERLLRSGELVPIFHPLPVMVETVVLDRRPAAPVGVPSKQPPDLETFDGSHPAATQASTLQRAAQSGAAFCEVCNRMAGNDAKLTWISIVLLDSDKQPVAGQPYEIEFPDGSVMWGVTNAEGKARHDDIPAGKCKVRFPDLDGAEWKLTS